MKNTDGTYKYGGINALGINYGTKPYELWSNEEGTSWSIREPEEIELGGSGFSLDGGITSTPGNIVVTDGIKVLGYENVLSDDEIKDSVDNGLGGAMGNADAGQTGRKDYTIELNSNMKAGKDKALKKKLDEKRRKKVAKWKEEEAERKKIEEEKGGTFTFIDVDENGNEVEVT